MVKLDRNVIIVAIVIALGLALSVFLIKSKSKEGFSETLIDPRIGGNNVKEDDYFVNKPNLKSDLTPRFDPHRNGGGYIKASYPPLNVQGAGITPLSDSEFTMTKEGYSELDFTTLGNQIKDERAYKQACDSMKDQQELQLKSAQGYSNPEDLLPTPDLRSCIRDPSDSDIFMYDRTIFAPLKRRNRNDADWIRGDLRPVQQKLGWFDSPSIPEVDLVRGAVQFFGTEIDGEDAVHSRGAPVVSQMLENKMKMADNSLPMGDFTYHLPR